MGHITPSFIYHPGPPPGREAIKPCEHERLRFVWKIFRGENQPVRYGYQCVQCGSGGHKGRNGEIYSQWVAERNAWDYFGCQPCEAVSFHDKLTDDIQRARDQFYAARREARSQWWPWYNQYLSSPAWQDKRQAVFRRDGNACQACGGTAEQVHHLRYDNVGYEPLEDLVSICGPCHSRIHG